MKQQNLFKYWDSRAQVVVGIVLGLAGNALLISCWLLSKLDKINIFEF